MSLRIARLAPHPQILVSMDVNQDGEDPISKLVSKKLGDILSSLTSTISSEQVIDS